MENQTKPIIFEEGNFGNKKLQDLKKSKPDLVIIDLYELQLEELLEIHYPNATEREKKRKEFFKSRLSFDTSSNGTWVFLRWNSNLLHLLNNEDFYNLRTNRNRELITQKEQEKVKDYNIGIAGLSIGSNLAYVLTHLGARNFKLADFDKLSTSNLNRVRATLADLDKNKAVLTTQNIYETDPFAEIEVITEGVNKNNLSNFLQSSKKLDIVVDSIDDFEMKIRLRQKSKEIGLPVLMFTNLGDSTLIDIERYDLEPNLEIFNGLLAGVPKEILNSKMTDENKKGFAAKLVGIENVPTRAIESLTIMGTDLVGRPQLASTVAISSGMAAFLIKQIALGEKCSSGRYLVHYDSAIFSNNTKNLYQPDQKRQELLSKLMKG